MEGSTEFDFDTMTLAKSRFKEVIEEICEVKHGARWTSPSQTQAATWLLCVVRASAILMANGPLLEKVLYHFGTW